MVTLLSLRHSVGALYCREGTLVPSLPRHSRPNPLRYRQVRDWFRLHSCDLCAPITLTIAFRSLLTIISPSDSRMGQTFHQPVRRRRHCHPTRRLRFLPFSLAIVG